MASASPQHADRERHVAEALEHLDLTALDLWNDLDILATHVEIEHLEVPVEGVVIHEADRFSAVMNIYLVLQYGANDQEGFRTSDSFLAKLSGRLTGNEPLVEHSSVDISSFYE